MHTALPPYVLTQLIDTEDVVVKSGGSAKVEVMASALG